MHRDIDLWCNYTLVQWLALKWVDDTKHLYEVGTSLDKK